MLYAPVCAANVRGQDVLRPLSKQGSGAKAPFPGGALDQVIVDGMLVIAAGRVYASSRPPVLARPRRGNADLPDHDAPDRTPDDLPETVELESAGDRWIVPASLGLIAVAGTIVARAVLLL